MSTELYSKTVTGLAFVFRRQTVALGHDEKVKPPAFAELVGLGFWVSLFNGRCSKLLHEVNWGYLFSSWKDTLKATPNYCGFR